MSTSSEQWSPGSRKSLAADLGAFILSIGLFSAFALWKPFFIEVSPTPAELAVSILIGIILCIVMLVASLTDASRRLWHNTVYQAVIILTLVIGFQMGLQLLPMWTIHTMLAAFIAMIPGRLYLYHRARQQ